MDILCCLMEFHVLTAYQFIKKILSCMRCTYHIIWLLMAKWTVFVGPCHHGMTRPQVADGGTASDMEGSCE